ncbi:hypothetical protein KY314_01725 [Candidatus Woesearchaeota archaeon]|nr:hypothetical protein [Candidatus Woesearchaeota archaeon]
MEIKELLRLLNQNPIGEIEFEDFNGNRISTLNDFDFADIDTDYINEKSKGDLLRLQLKNE